MPTHKLFRTWCPLGDECSKHGAQLCKELTHQRCIDRLLSHLTNSPFHGLSQDEALDQILTATITEEDVEDVEEKGPDEDAAAPGGSSSTRPAPSGERQDEKRRRIPTTPPAALGALGLGRPSASHTVVATLNTAVTELTAAVSRMSPPVPSAAPAFGSPAQVLYGTPPPPAGPRAISSSAGSSASHVLHSDLQLVLDSITRAEAAARQAAHIAQSAATAFNAEAAVLQQAKDTLRINVFR